MDNSDLQNYIDMEGIDAEILTMKGRVHSVEAASKELGIPPDRFIKTVVFVDGGSAILAIVLGTDRASSKRIGKALCTEPPRLATPKEALKMTGYAVGGTPPISIKSVRVVIDNRVTEMNEVVGGGGSEHHLIRIKPSDILRCTDASVIRVRK